MLKIHTITLMPEVISEVARRAVEFYYGVPDTTLRRVNVFLLEGEELVLIDTGYEGFDLKVDVGK